MNDKKVYCNNCKHSTRTGVHGQYLGCKKFRKVKYLPERKIIIYGDPKKHNANNNCNKYEPSFFKKLKDYII